MFHPHPTHYRDGTDAIFVFWSADPRNASQPAREEIGPVMTALVPAGELVGEGITPLAPAMASPWSARLRTMLDESPLVGGTIDADAAIAWSSRAAAPTGSVHDVQIVLGTAIDRLMLRAGLALFAGRGRLRVEVVAYRDPRYQLEATFIRLRSSTRTLLAACLVPNAADAIAGTDPLELDPPEVADA